MDSTRRARLESVILERLSEFIPREIRDPRVSAITITRVTVAQDGSQATIMVTLLGGQDDARKTEECIQGLNSASGYLRRLLAPHLTIRHIPSLIFKQDKGLENSLRVHELLKQLEKEKK